MPTAKRTMRHLASALIVLILTSALPYQNAWSFGITSINLCSDLIVHALSNESDIRSLSAYAHSEKFSPISKQTQKIGINHGRASEIIAEQSDLVVANIYSSPLTIEMLEKFDTPLYIMPMPESLEALYQTFLTYGKEIKQTARAKALIKSMKTALQPVKSGAPLRAIYLGPNGYSFGQGTLKNEIMHLAGFENLTAKLKAWHSISLEQILTLAPDVIITAKTGLDYDRANEWLQHPALKTVKHHIQVPEVFWGCPSPFIVDAYQTLKRAQETIRLNLGNLGNSDKIDQANKAGA